MRTRLLTLITLVTTSCANLPYQTTSSKCLFPIDSAYLGGLINYSLDLDEIDLEERLELEDLTFATCKSGSKLLILAPVPLAYPEKKVQLTLSDKVIASIKIADKSYRESRIEIQNNNFVNPSEVTQKRIKKEYTLGQKAKNTFTRKEVKQVMMEKPLKGIISSEFGVKRFINGQPRNRHIGLDIAANEGTPVQVPLAGNIILSDNFFYKGNVVYIDHGDGLVSSYSHLSNRAVDVGQVVSSGEVLGFVGSTGRVTGPHLHWEVFYLGIPINPEIFLKIKY